MNNTSLIEALTRLRAAEKYGPSGGCMLVHAEAVALLNALDLLVRVDEQSEYPDARGHNETALLVHEAAVLVVQSR